MKRVSLLLTCLTLVAACKDHSQDYDFIAGERRAVGCAVTTIKYLGQQHLGQSTNPTDGNMDQHVTPDNRECWMWTIDVDGEHSKGSLARLDENPALGCGYTGTGPSYEVDLDKGFCAATTPEGYYRFTLTSVTEAPTEWNGLELDGILEWSRGEDLLAGPAFIFLSIPFFDPNMMKPTYDKRIPVDPIAGCKMPACSRTNFGGRGTLLAGDPLICNELLAQHTEPVSLYFDDNDRMSFDTTTPEAMRRWSVHGLDTCTADAWTGTRPYPFARYHIDPDAGTVTLEETQLHQANNLTDVCKIRWTANLSDC